MAKRYFWVILLSLVFYKIGFADDNSDTVDADLVEELFALGKGWGSLGLYAILGILIKIAMDVLKSPFFGGLLSKVSDTAKMICLLGLSTLSVGVTVLVKGGSPADVITAIMQSASGAMFVHELFERVIIPRLGLNLGRNTTQTPVSTSTPAQTQPQPQVQIQAIPPTTPPPVVSLLTSITVATPAATPTQTSHAGPASTPSSTGKIAA